MNYIEFLKSLEPFIDRGVDDYFTTILIVILSICILFMLPSVYIGLKEFKNTKKIGGLFASIGYSLMIVIEVYIIYNLINPPLPSALELKEVKIDNKENIEFYKTIIRSPYYQKMDDSDKNAVYAATFNGIICGDDGCLNNAGEPLLMHKNFALEYAIKFTSDYNNTKINKDFGKTISLKDLVYEVNGELAYNGVSYRYQKEFNKFLEKTPKAVEAIENAKRAYKNLEMTYGSDWK